MQTITEIYHTCIHQPFYTAPIIFEFCSTRNLWNLEFLILFCQLHRNMIEYVIQTITIAVHQELIYIYYWCRFFLRFDDRFCFLIIHEYINPWTFLFEDLFENRIFTNCNFTGRIQCKTIFNNITILNESRQLLLFFLFLRFWLVWWYQFSYWSQNCKNIFKLMLFKICWN